MTQILEVSLIVSAVLCILLFFWLAAGLRKDKPF
jgi:hypothetical protein